ncbi:Acetoin dehydrogenase operon transcriptional activator AcoR [Nonomuraea coxensis DSM 45129]|uniref:Acetoin dehydrogenase operon transcriptional activator AcoR n=1 Tax=Nonomuraea coxensis DSM 45129 TaxID=1122611 RepID=A0ABX8UDU1_9ACTN|nr:helix-turn-helix domain-containing protein [Nonomuraea coxensis]QYC45964.1 Acetoin dehydrogenase operon transcriptional activator AcoR [Nonomuraea coxensis DSM 45129]
MSYGPLDACSCLLPGGHEAAATGGVRRDPPRRLIQDSWRRSLAAGIDPEASGAPLVYDAEHLDDVRRAHPLRPLVPLLAATLADLTTRTGHIMIISDGHGRVLWRDGDAAVLRRADQIGLSGGHEWGEPAVGTNGIGTALAAGRPVHVYSEEHLMRVLRVWSCSGAPITDPDSGLVIGCVDVSGVSRSLHPATVALVGAAAKLAESQLALRMHERDERLRRRYESLRVRPGVLLSPTGRVICGDPGGRLGERVPLWDDPADDTALPAAAPPWGPAPSARLPGGRLGSASVPGSASGVGLLRPPTHAGRPRLSGQRMILRDGSVAMLEPFSEGYLLRAVPATAPATLTLSFLGESVPSVTFGDHERPLSLRHAEILALLALHPHGLTAEQLSFHVYGDAGNPVTIRAEIHRLRTQLGKAISAKPYRLACPVEADFLTLRRSLAAKDASALARAYKGPLLPRSESPEIRRERDELEAQVRACLLRHGSPEHLWAYAQTSNGRDDYEILERLAALHPTDTRAAAARTRLLP